MSLLPRICHTQRINDWSSRTPGHGPGGSAVQRKMNPKFNLKGFLLLFTTASTTFTPVGMDNNTVSYLLNFALSSVDPPYLHPTTLAYHLTRTAWLTASLKR